MLNYLEYTIEIAYKGFKKTVTMDYPYDIGECWSEATFEDFTIVYDKIIEEHSHINHRFYSKDKHGLLMLNYLNHYVILGHRFANYLYKKNKENLSEAIYYSVRLRGSIDLFYTTEIGKYFMPVHLIGTVLAPRVTFGKLFTPFQCTLVAQNNGFLNKNGSEANNWTYPVIGDYVTLLPYSKVLGNSRVGNNVIVSNGATIINQDVPDECIVFGTSPNLIFKPLKTKNSDILIGNYER